MRAIIVTVYNSSNYGAYLQAKALQKFLENECGIKVAFLKTGARKSAIKVLYDVCLMIKSKSFHGRTVLFNIKKEFFFHRNILDFKTCALKEITDSDLCIFGSDEIWNIKKKAFYFFPIFWGYGIDDSICKIAYAPSINNTSEKQIRAYKKGLSSLQTFRKISVRDKHSLDVISSITGKKIEIVLDPTLLPEKSFYSKMEEEIYESNYILIYSYGVSFKKQYIDEIKKISKRERLKIISVGNYLHWCDESILCSAGQFLSYVKNAKYCFTDTFHGTIFSLIYHKNVGVLAKNARKVRELLELLDMSQCIIQENESLYDVLNRNLDYTEMEKRLVDLRVNSRNFIKKSLELI